MPVVGDTIQRVITVTSGGNPVTGLTDVDFAFVLKREEAQNVLAAAPETVTSIEISAGMYWVQWDPLTDGLYTLDVSSPARVVTPSSFQVNVGAFVFQPQNPVRHVVLVTNIGVPQTGLTTASFQFTLQRQVGNTLLDAGLTVTATEINDVSEPGKYWIDYTPTEFGLHILTVQSGSFTLTPASFQDDIGGAFGPVSGPYLSSRSRTKMALDITGIQDDTRIEHLLAQITADVESFTRRALIKSTRTWYPRVDVCRTAINLPDYPVISITSVHVSQALPRVYDATTELTAGTDFVVDMERGILHHVSGFFPAEPQAVQVVFEGGYDPVPADLERAAQEVVAVKLAKARGKLYHIVTQSRPEGGELAGIRIDDWTPSARRTFERYRRTLVA